MRYLLRLVFPPAVCMQLNTMLCNVVKRKNRNSLCSQDQLVKQTKIIQEMSFPKYLWQRNGLSVQLLPQAGAIWGAGL